MPRRRTVVEGPWAPAAEAFSQRTLIGWIAGNAGAVPLVDFAENPSGPVRARTTLKLNVTDLEHAAACRQKAVLLILEPGDAVLVGLIQSAEETPLLDAVLAKRPREAKVDGVRVVLEAAEEIVLRCGQSSITLRRNGRVSIRGVELETRARGLQRIRGGKVEIN
jgi:hypothetical protein